MQHLIQCRKWKSVTLAKIISTVLFSKTNSGLNTRQHDLWGCGNCGVSNWTLLIHPCIARKFLQITVPMYANCPLLVASRSANHWQQINNFAICPNMGSIAVETQIICFVRMLRYSHKYMLTCDHHSMTLEAAPFVMVCKTRQKMFKILKPKKKCG